ncbi:hypothetical protein F4808DRAFT_297993 [Astrocystis sublimbata]|nr:hypothetical protein F4808DRAFT_297993 [Astrocystis sublimbata]
MALTLVLESSIWYAFTVLVVAARVICRKALLGSFRKFQADDVLMILALISNTLFLIAINLLRDRDSNLIDPAHPPDLTAAEIERRIIGSKLVLVVEQTQILTIWLIKACLLFMYSRLTFSRVQILCMKLTAAYAGIGFLVMELLYFAVWCRPFNQYWAVPPNSTQCSAATNHLITNAAFNISSDIFILIIPMPIFLHINIAPRKKAILCGVFTLGLFTIGAAIANKFYSFTEPYGSQWTYWYVRESSTAIIVANIPFLWTIMRFFFRLTSFSGSRATGKVDTPAGGLGAQYGHNAKGIKHNTVISRGSLGGDMNFEPLKSTEDIKYYEDNVPLKIYRRHEIHITCEASDGSESDRLSKDRVSFNI